jgi:hypothetical protein
MLSQLKLFLNQSIDIYSKNFKLFTLIAGISGLIGLISGLFSFQLESTSGALSSILFYVVFIVYVIFVTVYYGIRITILLTLVIYKTIHKEEFLLNDLFKETHVLFLNYFVTSLTIGLFVFGAIIVPIFLFAFEANLWVSIAFSVVSLIGVFFIVFNYGFALYICVLEPNGGDFLKKSKMISRSNKSFTTYFYLAFLIYFGLTIVLSTYLDQFVYFGMIQASGIIGFLITVFLTPLLTAFGLYSYDLLKDNYLNINKEEQTQKQFNEEEKY